MENKPIKKEHKLKVCMEITNLALEHGKSLEDDISQEMQEVFTKYGLIASDIGVKDQNIILADLIKKEVPTYKINEETKRITLWIIPLFLIVFLASATAHYFLNKPQSSQLTTISKLSTAEALNLGDTYHTKTQEFQTALQGGDPYTSQTNKTTIFTKGACIYAVGHLTTADKKANKDTYNGRMAKENAWLGLINKRKHEIQKKKIEAQALTAAVVAQGMPIRHVAEAIKNLKFEQHTVIGDVSSHASSEGAVATTGAVTNTTTNTSTNSNTATGGVGGTGGSGGTSTHNNY